MMRALLMCGMLALGMVVAAPAMAGHGHQAVDCCEPVCCEAAPVCCEPPPVEVCLVVVDPCTGCTYQVKACVPACCAAELPCLVDWRKGIFGRKVLTYKWQSCGHCVDVVITKHGKTIVRD